MAITIANRLEVLLGNKVLIPGCEPTSAFTSTTLDENRECNASVISLADALDAVPGSTLIALRNPRRLFFVLPSGPPPTPNSTVAQIDHYQALRSAAPVVSPLKTIVEIDTSVLPQTSFTLNADGSISTTTARSTSSGKCDSFPLRGIF